MLFEMALTLTVAAILLELMLVYRYRLLLELFERNMLLVCRASCGHLVPAGTQYP